MARPNRHHLQMKSVRRRRRRQKGVVIAMIAVAVGVAQSGLVVAVEVVYRLERRGLVVTLVLLGLAWILA